ncbi:MAG: hypothetical protein AAF673_00980 [Pseudomonadota bacterium]
MKVLNYGTLNSEYIEERDSVMIDDALIAAARDGKNIRLLKAFARGECDNLTKDNYSSLMRQVLYTANLNDHDEVIKEMFGINLEVLEFYDKNLLGYDNIKHIHAELSGEIVVVVDESST